MKRFKKELDQDIFIAGVLSPFLSYSEDSKNLLISCKYTTSSQVKYLGETNDYQLKILKRFNDPFFEFIIDELRLEKVFRLPPWVFDYNCQFYKKQNEVIEKFLELQRDDIPTYEDLSFVVNELIDDAALIHESVLVLSRYISIFVYANKQLPLDWRNNMEKWTKEFIDFLYRPKGEDQALKLPYLYLAILKSFLRRLSCRDFNPVEILRLVGDLDHPFKLYDPLGIIKNFCNTLSELWENCDSYDLKSFKHFKFNGLGILLGKNYFNDPWITILAYCGGKTNDIAGLNEL